MVHSKVVNDDEYEGILGFCWYGKWEVLAGYPISYMTALELG